MGWSQAEAAEKCGVKRETWSRYESGLMSPGMEVLAALAAAGADVQYILTGESDVDPVLLALSKTERIKAVLDLALEVVHEVQDERGVEFSAENLQTLMGYAYTYCTTKKALKTFADSVFWLAKDLPKAG